MAKSWQEIAAEDWRRLRAMGTERYRSATNQIHQSEIDYVWRDDYDADHERMVEIDLEDRHDLLQVHGEERAWLSDGAPLRVPIGEWLVARPAQCGLR